MSGPSKGRAARYAQLAADFREAVAQEPHDEAAIRADYDAAVAKLAAEPDTPDTPDAPKMSGLRAAATTGLNEAALGQLPVLAAISGAIGGPMKKDGKWGFHRVPMGETEHAVQQEIRQAREQHPNFATAGALLGGVLPMMTGAGEMRAGAQIAERAAPVAETAVQRAALAARPWAQKLREGVVGGAQRVGRGVVNARPVENAGKAAFFGGASAAGGTSGDLKTKGMAALAAAPLAAGLGAALPAGGSMLGSIWDALPSLTRAGSQRVARKLMAEALQETEGGSARVAARIADPLTRDKPLTFLEYMGLPAHKLGRGARTENMQSAVAFKDLSQERMPNAPRRVVNDVREGLEVNNRPTTRGAQEQITAERRAVGAQEYSDARMAEEVPEADIHALLTSAPIYRDYHNAAVEAAAGGRPHLRLSPLFADDGSLVRPPTIRDVEEIRQVAQDQLAAHNGATVSTAGQHISSAETTRKRVAEDARSELMDNPSVNAHAPWYQPARETLASLHRADEALQESGALRRDPLRDVQDQFARAQPAERVAMRMGFANDLERQLTGGATANVSASRIAGGGIGMGRLPEPEARLGVRERLQTMAPNAPAYGVGPQTPGQHRMGQRLNAEDAIASSERFLAGGSNTADKLAESEKVQRVVKAVTGGFPVKDITMAFLKGNTGRVNEELSRMLSALNRDEQAAVLRAVERTRQQMLQRAALGRRLSQRGAGLTGTPTDKRNP